MAALEPNPGRPGNNLSGRAIAARRTQYLAGAENSADLGNLRKLVPQPVHLFTTYFWTLQVLR